MTTMAMRFDYREAAFPIADRIRACHLRDWERLRAPGAWWTGAERVAIARQTRLAEDCALCRERAATLSPASVAGECSPDLLLPQAAVDAIHKLITDKSRLSEQWYRQVVSAEGMSEERYIELLGVLVHVFAVDEPAPRPGSARWSRCPSRSPVSPPATARPGPRKTHPGRRSCCPRTRTPTTWTSTRTSAAAGRPTSSPRSASCPTTSAGSTTSSPPTTSRGRRWARSTSATARSPALNSNCSPPASPRSTSASIERSPTPTCSVGAAPTTTN